MFHDSSLYKRKGKFISVMVLPNCVCDNYLGRVVGSYGSYR